MPSWSERVRARLTTRRRQSCLSTVDGVPSQSSHDAFVAIGGEDMSAEGVRWCDFPVRLLDHHSLRSTKEWNTPETLIKRLSTCLRRLSVLDMGVIKTVFPSHASPESLAYDVLASQEIRQHERLRMAKNTPAPLWGVSTRSFLKYGSSQICQDAYPWVPAACRKIDDGMTDTALENVLVAIGRAGSRPIRWAIASVLSAAVLFILYATSTVMYIAIYSAARFAHAREHRADLVPYKSYFGDGFRNVVGFCIVNFLLWSFINFIIGVVWVEVKRPEVLSILERECAIQNQLWEERQGDPEQRMIKRLYVVRSRDQQQAGQSMMVRTSLFHKGIFAGSGVAARLVGALKRTLSSSWLYCIRYIEYPPEFIESFSVTHRVKNVDEALSESESGKLQEATDDFDDSESIDSVLTESYHPVVLVPPIHSYLTDHAVFSANSRLLNATE